MILGRNYKFAVYRQLIHHPIGFVPFAMQLKNPSILPEGLYPMKHPPASHRRWNTFVYFTYYTLVTAFYVCTICKTRMLFRVRVVN